MRLGEKLEVCTDCYLYTEYGYLYDVSEEVKTRCSNSLTTFQADNNVILATDGGDGSAEFAWTPCELCGSALGGTRHTLVAVSIMDNSRTERE